MAKKAKPATDWTWFQQGEISTALRTARDILRAGPLAGIYPSAVEQSMLTLLLIQMNDLLQKMDSVGHRLVMDNDIHPASNALDVTSLINNARNAACHLNSGHHNVGSGRVSYCRVVGRVPNAFVINDVVLGSDFADDAAVIFGTNRVYMKRHIVSSFNVAREFFRLTAGVQMI